MVEGTGAGPPPRFTTISRCSSTSRRMRCTFIFTFAFCPFSWVHASAVRLSPLQSPQHLLPPTKPPPPLPPLRIRWLVSKNPPRLWCYSRGSVLLLCSSSFTPPVSRPSHYSRDPFGPYCCATLGFSFLSKAMMGPSALRLRPGD